MIGVGSAVNFTVRTRQQAVLFHRRYVGSLVWQSTAE